MDLGMAKRKFATDPDAARALVDEAHTEAKRALAELRDLARGIHPAVLTDRGLDAALSALGARSPVPVDVQVDLDRRLPEPAEAVAYFIVAEALTNVAKHAAATEAIVRVGRRAGGRGASAAGGRWCWGAGGTAWGARSRPAAAGSAASPTASPPSTGGS